MKSKNIVFVHGLFGWGKGDLGGYPHWGEALQQFDGFAVHEASCGPISSFHDRACEVYAQIKGVPVDYGEKHSHDNGHARHNKAFERLTSKPLVADWSAENPVILVGHSAGAQTCMQLQRLLDEKHWTESNSADWIEAIICIAGVINGSTLTYGMGCDKKTGNLKGLGDLLGKNLQIMAGAMDWLNLYHFYLAQWQPFSFFPIFKKPQDDPFTSGTDNLAYDLALQGCRRANQQFKTNKNTYYLSVVTSQTRPLSYGNQNHFAKLLMNPLLIASATYQGAIVDFEPDQIPIEGWGFGDLSPDKWRENDGAVSSISQRYPFTGGNHLLGGEGFLAKESIERGKWYYERAEKNTGKLFDHLDVVFGYNTQPGSGLMDAHKKLYRKINERLINLA